MAKREYFYEYRNTARKTKFNYFVILGIGIFLYLISSIPAEKMCEKSGECHDWMIIYICGFLWFCLISALIQMLRNNEHGLILDTNNDKIIWFEFYPNIPYQYVLTSQIKEIVLDKSGDTTQIYILLKNNKKKNLSPHILPQPQSKWIEPLKAAFPEIPLVIKE